MPRRPRIIAIAAAIALALSGAALPATAEDSTDEARARFARGVELYREADFRAAIIEFQRAYELAPNYRILYNLGQTHLELLDYAAALKSFRRYLAEGGDEIPADRRAEVEREIPKLERRVGKVSVVSSVAGATITLDDVVVGTTPLEAPLQVSAGRRRIQLSKQGHTTTARVIDVAGGDGLEVSIDLPPVASSYREPAPAKPSLPRDVDTGPGAAFWVGLVTTGALAAGAAVVGALTLAADSAHDDEVRRLGVTPGELETSRERVVALAIATDVLAGSAIVAGGVTLVIGLSGGGDEPARRAAAPQPRGWTAGVAGSF